MEIVEHGKPVVEGATPVERLAGAGHIRVGWSSSLARIDGPVGMCENGYAFRDVDGSKVHNGWRTPYGESAILGDIIGMMIDLGKDCTKRSTLPPETHADSTGGASPLPLNSNRGRPETKPIKGSYVQFFKNGQDMGVAFQDLGHPGQLGYFATASVYQHAKVRFNPGPTFKFPPELLGYLPLSKARTFHNTSKVEGSV